MALLIRNLGLLIPPLLAYVGETGWVPGVVAEFCDLFGAAWNLPQAAQAGRSRPQVGCAAAP